MNDEQLRRDLHELARSFGDADTLKSDVRRRLETLDAAPDLYLPDERHAGSRGRSRQLVLAAAAACVMVLLGGLVLAARQQEPTPIAADTSLPSSSVVDSSIGAIGTAPGPLRFQSASVDPPVAFDLPIEPIVSLESESGQTIEFGIRTALGARLLVVLPPADEVGSVDESVEWLTSSLSQTTVDSIEPIDGVGVDATRVRLEPQAGMERVGFRFGPRTFISASGLDRRYEASIAERADGGIVVVWVDASDTELELASEVADIVLGSIEISP